MRGRWKSTSLNLSNTGDGHFTCLVNLSHWNCSQHLICNNLYQCLKTHFFNMYIGEQITAHFSFFIKLLY